MTGPSPLSEDDVRLLTLAEAGYTYRPLDALDGDFEALVGHLIELRERGVLRLEERRILRSRDGRHLLAGPCDVTEAGRRALAHDRRLGPRSS